MLNFFSGMLVMYLLGIPFMEHISEPLDEEDEGAPMRFALAWPYAALEVIWIKIVGDKDDDGTGAT
jgi:hypothetical protein